MILVFECCVLGQPFTLLFHPHQEALRALSAIKVISSAYLRFLIFLLAILIPTCGYIMQNASLDKAQAGIKIAWRNISNLRYADDTTLMAESEEELKSFLMKVKEENEKTGKAQHSKN